MSKSKIEWTEFTWNPIGGCRRAGSGCLHCYAERQAYRLAHNPNEKIQAMYAGLTQITNGRPGWTGEVRISESVLLEPLKRRKPTKYFISLSDLFYDARPDEHIDMVHQVMGAASWHEYVVLTKYVERAEKYYARLQAMANAWAPKTKDGKFTPSDVLNLQWMHRTVNRGPAFPYGPWPLPQLTFGVSISTQAEADKLIPILLRIPAARRIVSAEPLIEAVDLGLLGTIPKDISPAYRLTADKLEGVIVGGESGPNRRPMKLEWAESLVDQCVAAGTPIFVKQGSWGDSGVVSLPYVRGRQWTQWPEVQRA